MEVVTSTIKHKLIHKLNHVEYHKTNPRRRRNLPISTRTTPSHFSSPPPQLLDDSISLPKLGFHLQLRRPHRRPNFRNLNFLQPQNSRFKTLPRPPKPQNLQKRLRFDILSQLHPLPGRLLRRRRHRRGLPTANPQNTAAELSKQIKDCKPKLIVTVHELFDKIKQFNLPCIMLNPNPRTSTNPMKQSYYSDIIESPLKRDFTLPKPMQNDAAAILYSSGTTGASKEAVLTHKNFMASALMMTSDQETYGETKNVFLSFLPMFHIFGLSAVVYAQLQRGNAVVVMAKHEMRAMLRAIERYKVTYMSVVPPVVVEVIKNREAVEEYDVSSLREILSGAAPLGKDVMELCGKVFPQAAVCQAYGMTEATGVISFENRRARPPHSGSSGPLAPSMEAQIVDLVARRRLPPFQTGEIWIRGSFVMKGYLNNNDATLETVDEQGWLHTGDLGYFDDEGRLYILDRIKALNKYKGFRVSAAELEDLLLTHTEIVDAAVLGLPDAEAGEIPVAYVVRLSGSSLTREEVHQFIAQQVAPFKKLRNVIFTDVIPRLASGKNMKRELRKKFKQTSKSLQFNLEVLHVFM